MASRNLFKFQGFIPGGVIIAGRFKPNGSSAMDQTETYGRGFTVAYTSTGLYTITFTDKYNQLISFVPSLAEGTAGDQYVIGGTYTASAKTMTIQAWDVSGAALADIAAATNNYISFIAVFMNSSLKKSGS